MTPKTALDICKWPTGFRLFDRNDVAKTCEANVEDHMKIKHTHSKSRDFAVYDKLPGPWCDGSGVALMYRDHVEKHISFKRVDLPEVNLETPETLLDV